MINIIDYSIKWLLLIFLFTPTKYPQDKKLLSENLLKLDIWEEFIGTLACFAIKEDKSSLILQFSSGVSLMIPFSSDIKNRLKTLIGKRIGVLHTDLKDNEYLIRKEDRKF